MPATTLRWARRRRTAPPGPAGLQHAPVPWRPTTPGWRNRMIVYADATCRRFCRCLFLQLTGRRNTHAPDGSALRMKKFHASARHGRALRPGYCRLQEWTTALRWMQWLLKRSPTDPHLLSQVSRHSVKPVPTVMTAHRSSACCGLKTEREDVAGSHKHMITCPCCQEPAVAAQFSRH